MSLRSKVIGALLCVFFLYVLAAWLVLDHVHTPAFNKLEKQNAVEQLLRVNEFINAERADVDLLVIDWAEWDDMMEFVLGEYDEFYDDNLTGGYLNELGMSFGAIVDVKGQLVWGQSFANDGTITSIDYLFPGGFTPDNPLIGPMEFDEQVSGLIDTAQGPAIVASAAIFWSDGTGPSGGHMIAGKLLDKERMDAMGKTVLSTIKLFPFDAGHLPGEFQHVLHELTAGESSYALVKSDNYIHSLKLLRDINNEELAILSVRSRADISRLGISTLKNTIGLLVVAALVLTLTLWWLLKGMLLLPIEHLTSVLKGQGEKQLNEAVEGGYLHSTMKRLTESRGLISQRNDEIGELIKAFDELSLSLKDATTSVWRIAHLDGLTGLANRRLLVERLRYAKVAPHEEQTIALLFIDLDDFKIVNDKLGHDAGDKLLIEVASRIQSVVGVDGKAIGPEDVAIDKIVARIGGDEFVVFISSGTMPDCADRVASRLVDSIASPYLIDEVECVIGACVGLAVYPDDVGDINELITTADAAMYDAKRNGKNTWRRYKPGSSPVQEEESFTSPGKLINQRNIR